MFESNNFFGFIFLYITCLILITILHKILLTIQFTSFSLILSVQSIQIQKRKNFFFFFNFFKKYLNINS